MMNLPHNALELINKAPAKRASQQKGEGQSALVVAKPQGAVEFDRIMELFALCGKTSPEAFRRQNPDLPISWNEGAMLYFLWHTYSDSMKTVTSYARCLCQFSEFTALRGIVEFRGVLPEDITDYRSHLSSKGLKVGSINTYIAILKSFFKFLVDDMEAIDRNPARLLKRRLKSDSKKTNKLAKGKLTGHMTKVLTREQVEALLLQIKKESHERDALLVEFLYQTGARSIEVIRLCWSDTYHLGNPKEWFVQLYGKGSKEREVYIPFPLVQKLMKMRRRLFNVPGYVEAKGLANVPIFGKVHAPREPIQYDVVYKLVQKWGKVADLKLAMHQKSISPHWLRHTFATHAREAGYSENQLQYVLGHASPATTAMYGVVDHRTAPVGKMFE